MNQKITLYHGSEQIVESPTFGLGKQNNDFGLGFYCTESEELAKEWAVSSLRNGFVNRYSLDTEYLKILNLNSPDYTILNWIAVLVAHRLFSIKSPAAQRAKRYLIDNFGVNVNAYDLIIGYRADDSYFDFAASFLNNGISVQQLANLASWANRLSSSLNTPFRCCITMDFLLQKRKNIMSAVRLEMMKPTNFIRIYLKRKQMVCISLIS